MIKKMLLTALVTCFCNLVHAQIGIGTSNPHPSAILDVESVIKGFLPPRMDNSKIMGITNATEGLLLYSTDDRCLYFYNGDNWINACTGIALSIVPDFSSINGTKHIASMNILNGNGFGFSVDVSGDGSRAVIGEPSAGNGVVNVLKYDGGSWIEEARIVGPVFNGGANQFGRSTAISDDGTTIVAGAYVDGDGSAYIYKFDGTSWVQEKRLLPSVSGVNYQFGWSTAISGNGNTVIVGANTGFGAVYVFTYNGTTWVEDAILMASDVVGGIEFGHSVDLSKDGTVIVVGAIKSEDNGKGSGSAYVFKHNGSSWVEESKLLASNAAKKDSFGRSVSIADDGGTIAVGASSTDDGSFTNSGSVYIFKNTTGSWIEESILHALDADSYDDFGESVSLNANGTTVVVGAVLDNHSLFSSAGSSYVFKYTDGSWVEEAKLLATDPDTGDRFGKSVGISSDGTTIIIGAFGKDIGVANAGAAYIFK